MLLNERILQDLAAPFPEESLQCKPQTYSPSGTNADSAEKAMLVTFVSHTQVAERLDQVCSKYGLDWELIEDNYWTEEKTVTKRVKDGQFWTEQVQTIKDADGNVYPKKEITYYVKARLCIKGMVDDKLVEVSRIGVGEGTNGPKDCYSDALKRAAVNFGVARYLYDQDKLWIPWKKDYKYNPPTLAEAKKLLGRPVLQPTQAPKPQQNATRNDSTNRTANTVANLNQGGQQAPPKKEYDPVLKAAMDGLFIKLGAGTKEQKNALVVKFGKDLTPDTIGEFNKFLTEELSNR
jgi:hypothetical protein